MRIVRIKPGIAMTGAVDIASVPLCEKGNGILNTKQKRPMILPIQ